MYVKLEISNAGRRLHEGTYRNRRQSELWCRLRGRVRVKIRKSCRVSAP